MRNPRNETLEREAHIPERKCILSGDHAARSDLIRLALSPAGEVFPDIRAKAAGRGAWIGVGKAELETALAKGKLRGALVRAFKTSEVQVPHDLPQLIESALRRAALDRLGLEARAGNLITGSEKIEAAARSGEVELLIHAADASADGRRRLDQAWRIGLDEEGSGRMGLVFPEGRAILSLALGRENVVHVALVGRAAAARVAAAVGRWGAFIGREAGLTAAPADAPAARQMDVSEGLE